MPEIPYDREAEADLLVWIIDHPTQRGEALRDLVQQDFYIPEHRALFIAMLALHDEGRPVTTDTLAHETGRSRSQLLLEWQLQANPYNLEEHLRRVIAAADRRRVIVAATTLNERAYDADADLEVAIADARGQLVARSGLGPQVSVPYEEWAASVDLTHEWVIPGVLEHGDRVIIVAEEGVGKSWLLRQLAFQLACGFHPFTEQWMPAKKALVIDAENSDRQIVRAGARLLANAQATVGYEPGNMLVEPMWNIDLNARADRARVESYLEGNRPDLLIIGPLYKIFTSSAGRDYEANALAACRVLDDWRARFGCAVMIEHHAPKATGGHQRELFPFGSSVWLRWPEFGLSLGRVPFDDDPTGRTFKLGHFRGQRERRQWPLQLRQSYEPGTWPWRVPQDEREGRRRQ